MNEITVCLGNNKTKKYPLQVMVNKNTLRNVYKNNSELPGYVIEAYNAYTAEINRCTWHADRESWLNARHAFYVSSMSINN